MAHDVAWYVKKMGLTTRGIDVLILAEKDVPISQIEEIFGPKFSKNGHRYDRKVSTLVVHNIFELYKSVTRKHKVTNGQINEGFARGVICWMNGNDINWAKYVVYCNKYATELRETKVANLVWQVELGVVREVKQAPQLPTCKCVKVESKVVDVKALKRKGIQVLNEEQTMNMKLKEQELVWADQVAKVVKSIFVFEKKKSKISQLDFEGQCFKTCRR